MRHPAAPVAQLQFNELREMQQLLVKAGFNVGKVDGIMGQQSRTAVKAMQVKYGLPADSWPTAELLARMRGVPQQAPRSMPHRERRARAAPPGAPASCCAARARAIGCPLALRIAFQHLTLASSHHSKEHHMSFYDATVPAFLQILGSLSGLLTKAEAHCTAKNIQPEVLLSARLYPDMLPLSKQIQLASDFAAKGCARRDA